ncbi:carbohydrate ABC transporter permease [Thermomonospora umbrina]|uniref:Carbohydrate ABC transporter membrane protein 1 (CUT1 family) n=1 Tax=Thermomonospora umbrina TaxID=111806 RepID=A0A3D9SV33_9ACTN|nr:sugar ABC transporter permease [Thermomonospora umbrina]REE99812.1 carbohydrate ABC transporter membrane protein 1 (CUT1 family) [Thermomonospora umbrina]
MGGAATNLGRARSGPRDQGPVEPARRSAKGTGQGRLAALLLSPTLLVLGVVILFPIVAAVWDSLHTTAEGLDADGLIVEGERFSGADNYADLFRGESGDRFRNALWNTTFFTVVTVVIETVAGLGMALLMHRAFRGRALFRASVLVPWAIPTAISALLWRWIFAADGVANAVLGREVLWTADAVQAKFAVIIADTWKTAPFVALLVLAGLQVIPREVYEAARVDGASRLRRLRHITLPLVKPALLVAVMFRMMDALRMFDLPQVLVGARKPSVETLSQVAWDEAMNLRYGPAAAVATALFVYIALAAYVFVRLLGADLIGDRKGAS